MRLHRSLALCGLLTLTLAGCEFPQAPDWNVGLLVPFTRQDIGIDSVLPIGVRVDRIGQQPAFLVDTEEESESYSLALMCSACAALVGDTTTVPGFNYTDTVNVRLPDGVISVDVVTLSLGFRVSNGLNFDPLRPNPDPDAAGRVEIQALDMGSGALLDSTIISGANETFPSGTTREGSLEIRDATIAGGVLIVASINSPEDGQQVAIDTTLTASVEPLTDTIAVSAITAEVQDRPVRNSFTVAFDSGVRNNIRDNVRDALVELELRHDLDIVGVLDISLAGSPTALFSGGADELRLEPLDFSRASSGRSVVEELTMEEIQFLAGLPEIYIGYDGLASARTLDAQGRPAVTFTPTDSIVTRLKVTTTVAVEP